MNPIVLIIGFVLIAYVVWNIFIFSPFIGIMIVVGGVAGWIWQGNKQQEEANEFENVFYNQYGRYPEQHEYDWDYIDQEDHSGHKVYEVTGILVSDSKVMDGHTIEKQNVVNELNKLEGKKIRVTIESE